MLDSKDNDRKIDFDEEKTIYSCFECDDRFETFNQFLVHRTVHYKILLQSDKKLHLPEGSYFCPLCLMSCNSLTTSNSVICIKESNHINENAWDTICSKMISKASQNLNIDFFHAKKEQNFLNTLQSTVHKFKQNSTSFCFDCQKIIPCDCTIIQTSRVRQYTCDICSKAFYEKYILNRHRKIHTEIGFFECSECTRTFSRKDLRNAHFNKMHSNEKFTCDVCCKIFYSPYTLKQHKMIHTEECYKCGHCEKKFYKRCSLTQHIKARHSTTAQLFLCNKCPKSFTCEQYLKRHQSIHNEDKCFTCPLCLKKFSCKSFCDIHMESVHSKNKFLCDMCPKSFMYPGNLKVHRKVHSDIECQKCPVCEKRYPRKDYLKRHIEITHNNNGKRFECDVCQKTFGTIDYLKLHRKLHNDDECFKCSFCPKKFPRKYNRDLHVQRIHKDCIELGSDFTANM